MALLTRKALRDTRYYESEWGTERRRVVPRKEMEQQLRQMLADGGIEVSVKAFNHLSDGELYYLWQDCLHGEGSSTPRYGQLPVRLIAILEREGFDPDNKRGLPTQLFERWLLVPNPPDWPEGDARELVAP